MPRAAWWSALVQVDRCSFCRNFSSGAVSTAFCRPHAVGRVRDQVVGLGVWGTCPVGHKLWLSARKLPPPIEQYRTKKRNQHPPCVCLGNNRYLLVSVPICMFAGLSFSFSSSNKIC